MTTNNKKTNTSAKKSATSAKPAAPKKKPATAKASSAKPVAKKSAAPKTTAKKTAVKKSAPKSATKPSTPTANPGTSITAKADVGFGNQLFIRGEGPGLDWDRGVPMTCRDSSHWEWTASGVAKPFNFKLLINDQIWSHGENFEAQPKEHKMVEPDF